MLESSQWDHQCNAPCSRICAITFPYNLAVSP